MFGIYRLVFRSPKWAALWAGGLLLTAYFTVPREGEDPAAAIREMAARQAAQAESLAHPERPPAEQPAEAAPSEPVDPWALEK